MVVSLRGQSTGFPRGMSCAALARYSEASRLLVAWAAPNDAGYDFDTCGVNRRIPEDFDGMKLVRFFPVSDVGQEGG